MSGNGESEVDELVQGGDFRAALLMAGRNDGPILLRIWWENGKLTLEQLRELLPDVWCLVEFPQNALGMLYWLKLFKTTGFVTDEPGLVKPDEQLTVYRGCTLETRGRLSWTTDLDRAEWFATRLKYFGEAGSTVYSADVPPRHVLGLIKGRNEHEVVVNPYGLRSWTALGMCPRSQQDGCTPTA